MLKKGKSRRPEAMLCYEPKRRNIYVELSRM